MDIIDFADFVLRAPDDEVRRLAATIGPERLAEMEAAVLRASRAIAAAGITMAEASQGLAAYRRAGLTADDLKRFLSPNASAMDPRAE